MTPINAVNARHFLALAVDWMREDEVMESDKKRGSGWRALGTAIGGFMMIPLTLYVAAYFWTVFPCPNVHVARPLSDEDLETILSGRAVPR